MINITRMELFRLFKTRSLYVILLITVFYLGFATFMQKDLLSRAQENSVSSQEPEANAASEDAPISLTVSANTDDMEDISEEDLTLSTSLYDSVSALLLGLFLVIAAVLFSTADATSGFIKNIGGQVSSRSILILAKAFALFIYTLIFFAVYIIVQALSNQIFFGCVRLGNISELAKYLLLQVLLHFALALVCMLLTILIRNNIVNMILAILLCSEITPMLLRFLNQFIARLGMEDFDLTRYSLISSITSLDISASNPELLRAGVIGICFAVFSLLLSCFIFKKRDIA